MRTLIAIALFAGGVLALYTPAESADATKKRGVKARTYVAQPRVPSREDVECERARHEDPTGLYAGLPCWARETFGGSKNRADH
jgi:hypothetical protein